MPDRMLKQIFLSICELTAVSKMKNNGFLNELLFGPFLRRCHFKVRTVVGGCLVFAPIIGS